MIYTYFIYRFLRQEVLTVNETQTCRSPFVTQPDRPLDHPSSVALESPLLVHCLGSSMAPQSQRWGPRGPRANGDGPGCRVLGKGLSLGNGPPTVPGHRQGVSILFSGSAFLLLKGGTYFLVDELGSWPGSGKDAGETPSWSPRTYRSGNDVVLPRRVSLQRH